MKEMHHVRSPTGATSIVGQWLTVPKLSGFCLLMKRAVYEKVGGLDEDLDWGSSTTMTSPSGRAGWL